MNAKHALWGAWVIACGSADSSGLYEARASFAPPTRLQGEPPEPDSAEPPGGSPTQIPSGPDVAPPLGSGAQGEEDIATSNEDIEPSAPPEVLWTEPGDGERGVRADTDIAIQFSKSMDAASVERALRASIDAELHLSWEGAGSLLRIRPSAPLPYAEGAGAEAPRLSIELSEGAKSSSGEELPRFALTFSTLRRVRLELTPSRDPELTGNVPSQSAERDAGSGEEPEAALTPLCSNSGALLCAGDVPDGADGWIQLKAFMTFDLRELPAEVEVESARLRIVTDGELGAPFAPEGLGNLHVERSNFGSLGRDAFDADPDAMLLALDGGSATGASGDISWVIEEARDPGLTQYRLVFPQATNRDGASDLVTFVPSRQTLEITYLLP